MLCSISTRFAYFLMVLKISLWFGLSAAADESSHEINSLIQKLSASQPKEARLKALEQLDDIRGSESLQAIPALRVCLKDKDKDIRTAAVDVFALIARRNKQPYPIELVSALFDSDETVRGAATNWIATAHECSKDAIPLLVKAIESSDDYVRTNVLALAGEIAAKEPTLLAAVRNAANDVHFSIRNSAQSALWRATKDLKAFVRFKLLIFSLEENWEVPTDSPERKKNEQIGYYLNVMSNRLFLADLEKNEPKQSAEVFVALLADKSAAVRTSALRRLGLMSQLSPEVLAILEGLSIGEKILATTKDPDLSVRAQAFLTHDIYATERVRAAFSRGTPISDPRNPIVIENDKLGSLDWQLTRVKVDKASGNFRSSTIEGYCSHQSVKAGDTLDIMVSTSPAAKFKIEIFRTGYYQGRGARLMTTLGPFEGKEQPVPPVGKKRLRECKWAPATSVKIPENWLSGVYLGRLTTLPEKEEEPYWQSYVVFIVRDDRKADILFQCSDNTWQAYNRWPDSYSVYTDPKGVQGPWSQVSFDRPYAKYAQIYDNPQSIGSGEWLCFEFPVAFWLEKHGYDVSYCSNSDMLSPERGLKCKAFISVGHDEYWDIRAFQSVTRLRDSGVNLLFLSGNTACWVTPLTPSSSGQPKRIMYRGAPYGGKHQWAEQREKEHGPFPEPRGPDEGYLIGARNIEPDNGGGDWIVVRPDHWVFEKTGMKKGDRVPGLVGYEYHGDPPKDLAGLEILAEGTAWQGGVRPKHWTATMYPGPKGNFVFNGSSIFWAQGLSSPPGHMLPWSHWNRPHGPDVRVQQITRNLLTRALAK